jgi:hypothetical protein
VRARAHASVVLGGWLARREERVNEVEAAMQPQLRQLQQHAQQNRQREQQVQSKERSVGRLAAELEVCPPVLTQLCQRTMAPLMPRPNAFSQRLFPTVCVVWGGEGGASGHTGIFVWLFGVHRTIRCACRGCRPSCETVRTVVARH